MMNATSHTIVGVYSSRTDAERAVTDLLGEGFSRDQISIVAPESAGAPAATRADDVPNLGPIESVGSGPGPGTGAAVGSFAGFIAGMAALAIPGIGPILAAGPLAAGLMGAGIGAAAGTITGAMKRHGIPDHAAERYSAAVGRGSCLLTLHTTEDHIDHAADILERNGAISVDEPSEHVSQGSSISSTPHVTSEAVEAARLKEGDSLRDRQRARERRVGVFPGITGSGAPTEIV